MADHKYAQLHLYEGTYRHQFAGFAGTVPSTSQGDIDTQPIYAIPPIEFYGQEMVAEDIEGNPEG